MEMSKFKTKWVLYSGFMLSISAALAVACLCSKPGSIDVFTALLCGYNVGFCTFFFWRVVKDDV